MPMPNVHSQNTNNKPTRHSYVVTTKEAAEAEDILRRTLNVYSTCAQCNNLNKYPLPATPETTRRFGGQTYQILGRFCEQCGCNLWTITFPYEEAANEQI